MNCKPCPEHENTLQLKCSIFPKEAYLHPTHTHTHHCLEDVWILQIWLKQAKLHGPQGWNAKYTGKALQCACVSQLVLWGVTCSNVLACNALLLRCVCVHVEDKGLIFNDSYFQKFFISSPKDSLACETTAWLLRLGEWRFKKWSWQTFKLHVVVHLKVCFFLWQHPNSNLAKNVNSGHTWAEGPRLKPAVCVLA